jgi:hypothetical protein
MLAIKDRMPGRTIESKELSGHAKLLRSLGLECSRSAEETLKIGTHGVSGYEADYRLIQVYNPVK